MYASLSRDIYDAHIRDRAIRAANANSIDSNSSASSASSVVVVPEAFSQLSSTFPRPIVPSEPLTPPGPSSTLPPAVAHALPYTDFMNMQYLIVLHVLLDEGLHSPLLRVTTRVNLSNNPTSEAFFLHLLTLVLDSSVNQDNLFVVNKAVMLAASPAGSTYEKQWQKRAKAVLNVVEILINSTSYRPSDELYTLLVQKLCIANKKQPYSPSLARYVGNGVDLLNPVTFPAVCMRVDVLIDWISEKDPTFTLKSSTFTLQRAIFEAYLSYEGSGQVNCAKEYFDELLVTYRHNATIVEDIKSMYSSAMSRSSKRENTTKIAQLSSESSSKAGSLQSRLLHANSSLHESSSPVQLYSKVVETLLRAHRSADAKSLLQLMLAKNVSTIPEEIYVIMGHEIKAGNYLSVIEVFTAFFHMPNSSAPDARSVSLLAVALAKTKNIELGANLAEEILPFVLQLKLQLSVPVCEAYFGFCMHKSNTMSAVEYMLQIPQLKRKLSALLSIIKYSSINRQIDILNKLYDSSYPFEIVCHYIAGYSLKGLWKKTFNAEYLLRKACLQVCEYAYLFHSFRYLLAHCVHIVCVFVARSEHP